MLGAPCILSREEALHKLLLDLKEKSRAVFKMVGTFMGCTTFLCNKQITHRLRGER